MMQFFDKAGLIDESNKEIIAFGLNRLFDMIISWFFAILCADLMGDFFVGILFEINYMLLRSFTGGYHARNKKNCLILTYLSTFICIVLIFFVPVNILAMNIMVPLFDVIIFYYAPIQSNNKPLNLIEKKIYHRNSVFLAIVGTTLYFFFIWLGLNLYSETIFISMMMIIIGMLIGLWTV